MFTKEEVSRIFQYVIHFIIALVFIKYINYKYGFEQAVLFGIVMTNAEVQMLKSTQTKKVIKL